tara:strand:+ start:509 stop:955 length:447 start_codon:yes stop_codon:yes gene_type:complete
MALVPKIGLGSFYPCPDPSPIFGIIAIDRHQLIEELNFARGFSEASLHKLCEVRAVAVLVAQEDKPQPLTQRSVKKHRKNTVQLLLEYARTVFSSSAGFNRFHIVVEPECEGHERQNSQPEDRQAKARPSLLLTHPFEELLLYVWLLP